MARVLKFVLWRIREQKSITQLCRFDLSKEAASKETYMSSGWIM
jgi:hypothetical protein